MQVESRWADDGHFLPSRLPERLRPSHFAWITFHSISLVVRFVVSYHRLRGSLEILVASANKMYEETTYEEK